MELKKTETILVNEILYHLNKIGSFDRVSNVPAFDLRTQKYKRMSSYARKGASDISGTFNGRPFYIEVKTEKALKAVISYYKKIKHDFYRLKPTPTEKFKFHIWEQISYLKDKHDHGAICFFTCDHLDSVTKIKVGIDNYPNRSFLFID